MYMYINALHARDRTDRKSNSMMKRSRSKRFKRIERLPKSNSDNRKLQKHRNQKLKAWSLTSRFFIVDDDVESFNVITQKQKWKLHSCTREKLSEGNPFAKTLVCISSRPQSRGFAEVRRERRRSERKNEENDNSKNTKSKTMNVELTTRSKIGQRNGESMCFEFDRTERYGNPRHLYPNVPPCSRSTSSSARSRVRRGGHFKVLLGLMCVQNERLERSERAERTLELRRLAFVLQIVAPHLVELAALYASVAEHLVTHVHLAVC